MSWREWFGFTKPRDAPETELPQIEDNVRDSGGVFVFGMTNSGERVDEKSALQISTVYACVRLLAETVASLPLHLYKFTEKGDGKERATEHPLYKILYMLKFDKDLKNSGTVRTPYEWLKYACEICHVPLGVTEAQVAAMPNGTRSLSWTNLDEDKTWRDLIAQVATVLCGVCQIDRSGAKLQDLGIPVYFEKENLDTGSMESELLLSVMSSIAEGESVSISENAKWGVRHRFETGTFKISYPAYGYTVKAGEFFINEKEAEWVRYIFSEILKGKSTHQIAKALNEKNVPKRRRGSWSASVVHCILKKLRIAKLIQ